jgi:hypothetical protein
MNYARSAILAGCAVVLLGASAMTALAQDSGLVGLHALVRKGNKLCMAEHYHDGTSSNEPSKKAAEVVAIRVWQDFTAWEYGGAWGNFAMAESRGVSCSGSGNSWGCNVTGRPCRKR